MRSVTPSDPMVRRTIYAAPRRFDLATILVVTLAYAALFAVMRLLRWPLPMFGVVALFVTLVGVGQAVLLKGRAPRLASAVVGSVFFVMAPAILDVLSGTGQSLSATIDSLVLYVCGPAICVAVSGAIVGYCTGAMIGGVFLVIAAGRSCGQSWGRPWPPPDAPDQLPQDSEPDH
jgi:hypothetical protein